MTLHPEVAPAPPPRLAVHSSPVGALTTTPATLRPSIWAAMDTAYTGRP